MINIVYPPDGWIMHHIGEQLAARIPNSRRVPVDSGQLLNDLHADNGLLNEPGKHLNYFINYGMFRRKTRHYDVGFFTHPDPKGKFFEIADQVDYAVCMCRQYRDLLQSRGQTNCTYILLAADEIYRPKLVLGVVANISVYQERKGVALLEQVVRLDFVDLRITNGKLPREELPSFYRGVDYVLVASDLEGGPMCIPEGAACGKKIICPLDIGFADDYRSVIIPYERSNFESLRQVLLGLYARKPPVPSEVRDRTWDHVAREHEAVFNRILEG